MSDTGGGDVGPIVVAHCEGCGREIRGHDMLSLFDATERHLKRCKRTKARTPSRGTR